MCAAAAARVMSVTNSEDAPGNAWERAIERERERERVEER
jgi:hypothetical protein